MNTLTELKSTPQVAGEFRRRWFSSADMDLIVRYDPDDSIDGFELYYDKNLDEHVITWRKNSGFKHWAVDDGEQKPVLEFKQAPMLMPDGQVDRRRIESLFDQSCTNLPAGIVALVRQKLAQLTA